MLPNTIFLELEVGKSFFPNPHQSLEGSRIQDDKDFFASPRLSPLGMSSTTTQCWEQAGKKGVARLRDWIS